jgi:hypothetical protein
LKKSCVSRVDGGGATRVGVIAVCVDRQSADAPKQKGPRSGPLFRRKRYIGPTTRERRYLPRPVPASLLSCKDGLERTPLLVWTRVADPVVVPGFILAGFLDAIEQ